MWPFKKKSRADQAIEVMDHAVAVVSEKWLYFHQSTFALKQGVGLDEQIAMFSAPAVEGLKDLFPVLKGAPAAVLLLFIAMGVEHSGTHTRAQIEEALNVKIPD